MQNNLSYTQKFSSFYAETRDLVESYFTENNLAKTGNNRLFLRVVAIFGLAISSFVINLFLGHSIWLNIIFSAVTGVLIGVITAHAHESVHMVLAAEKWKNRLLTRFIDFMGACSLGYMTNHSKHHNFTNIEGGDTDLSFEPFIRLTKNQKRHWWHQSQHIYTPFLYAFSSLFLIWDIRSFDLYKNRKLIEKLSFWLVKLMHVLIFIVIPVLILGPIGGFFSYIVIMFSSGLYLGLLNEPVHLFKDTNFTEYDHQTNKIPITWDEVMLRSSANFAVNNNFLTMFSAGLNFHLVHSLFPKISHIHYPVINQIIKENALRHNLNYIEFPSYSDILKSHLLHLKEMGRD
jgi:linoleoyl-CoA desaturase